MRSNPTLSCLSVVLPMGLVLAFPAVLRADAFTDYTFAGAFQLPAAGVFDVLNDGRLLSLDGADLYLETAVGSREFSLFGTIPGADMPNPAYATPAFLCVSPDGSRIAVGNNGGSTWSNYQVGVFDIATLTGSWYALNHCDAAWIDDQHLALTAASSTGYAGIVSGLDTLSPTTAPTNPTLVDNIGGYSAGIAFDDAGNLYTGNGFVVSGPSDTGEVRAFAATDWMPALSGGSAVDFEFSGLPICDLLSAASLGFDAEGNLYVGGGDAWGSVDADYAGLVHSDAVAAALAGLGAADPSDETAVRTFDPDASTGSFYDVTYNGITSELLLHQGDAVYTYVVPEPATALMLLFVAGGIVRRRPITRLTRA